jgi:hypothetical protein
MKKCDNPSKIVKAGTILWCCQKHAEEHAQQKKEKKSNDIQRIL